MMERTRKPLDEFTFDLQRFDVDVWDGTTITAPTINDNSITINSAAELAWLAQQVNAGNYNGFSGITIKLGVDINLQNKSWTPIGNESNSFAGIFDGDGHTIIGLNVSDTS